MTVQELIDELEKLPPDWRVLVLSDANCSSANPNFYDLDWLEANDVDEDSVTESAWILHTKRNYGETV